MYLGNLLQILQDLPQLKLAARSANCESTLTDAMEGPAKNPDWKPQ